MKTAHEVLLDVKAARLRGEMEAEQWEKLMHKCRQLRWLALCKLAVILYLFGGVLCLLLGYHRAPDAVRPFLPFVPLVFILFVMVMSAMEYAERRSAGLIEAIKQEAPELYKKLEDEHVV
jgi:hypothetical protein